MTTRRQIRNQIRCVVKRNDIGYQVFADESAFGAQQFGCFQREPPAIPVPASRHVVPQNAHVIEIRVDGHAPAVRLLAVLRRPEQNAFRARVRLLSERL